MIMRLSNMRGAFTLAEVLITLGIIGVVAAMTMPTLMNSTQGAQYKAAYKKALSALSQAVTLNVALDDWNFADATGSGTYTLKTIFENRMNVVNSVCASGCSSTTMPQLSNGGTYSIANGGIDGNDTVTLDANSNVTLFFNDGIMFSFPANSASCTKGPEGKDALTGTGCRGFIDVNGVKPPNRLVKCDNSATDGTASETNCRIKNPTDVYPVVFYDQTILPSSVAARAVLYSK